MILPSDKLTELGLRKAKTGPKQRKLTDGRGLYLLLHPNGSKYWRMKYHFAGKEKMLSFGVWPEVSLIEARPFEDDARTRTNAKEHPRDGDGPSDGHHALLRRRQACVLSQKVKEGI